MDRQAITKYLDAVFQKLAGRLRHHGLIGKTGIDNLEFCIRNLFTTGVPVPFECYRASLVNDPDKVERLIHAVFSDTRANPRREFFRISVERAEAALMRKPQKLP